jgi:hypothetical protein
VFTTSLRRAQVQSGIYASLVASLHTAVHSLVQHLAGGQMQYKAMHTARSLQFFLYSAPSSFNGLWHPSKIQVKLALNLDFQAPDMSGLIVIQQLLAHADSQQADAEL